MKYINVYSVVSHHGFYNIDLHNCEQIFTHLHLNLSGKAFKVGGQHFSQRRLEF
jgi:hypothetical protein